MIRIAWRQQRSAIVLWLAAMAGFVAYMVVVGHAVQVDTRIMVAHGCSLPATTTAALVHGAGCQQLGLAVADDRSQAAVLRTLLVLLPILPGFLFGAPLVAGELEGKTNRLAWTQGVSRTRWLVAKGGLAAAAALLPFAAIAALMPWWRGATGVVGPLMDPRAFDVTGTVILGYALFAFALGALAGALLRRVAAAVVVTLLAYGVLQWVVQLHLRGHYRAPLEAVSPGLSTFRTPADAWVVTQGFLVPPGVSISHVLGLCAPEALSQRCLVAHHVNWAVWYQPAGRYWLFQGIETALFAGAALAMLGGTVWAVRRWRA